MGKIFSRKKQKKEKPLKERIGVEEATIDMSAVEAIVKRMKKKYRDEGIEFEEVGGRLRELRDIIAEEKPPELEIQRVEDLREFKRPMVQRLGKLYLSLRGLLQPVSKFLGKIAKMESLTFYLYSANMKYSAKQYLALATTAACIIMFAAFVISAVIMSLLGIELATMAALIIAISLSAFLFSAAVILLYPQQRAKQRADAISTELPFALRHMATELRAGIGLYRTIQAVATADYGPLSEEFARAITEIEEGTDTKDALRHLALRTQSKALRNSLMHVIRALKTGGNLSEIMNEIAEDVAFDLRMRMREFAQKMNFFGVIFIFVAIVMPVIISVLGGIRNAPFQTATVSFEALPLSPAIIAVIFLVLLPLLLLLFIFYIMISQPRV